MDTNLKANKESRLKSLENTYCNLAELGVKLIYDDEYEEYIHLQNADWRKANVKQGDITSFDGLSLRYYYALQNSGQSTDFDPTESVDKGCIVMVHGYCGFWGKFHEMAEYYWQAGYDVFFLEQRGHGYSGRQTDDKDVVHVNNYSDYVEDLKIFMDSVVIPMTKASQHILFAHSMGGAISALFLERHPSYFDGAILSSPMFSINTGEISKFAVYFLCAKVKLLHEELKPFPGGKRFDGVPVFSTSSTLSAARYNYIFEQRLADTHYHTYMLSNGWGCASFKATGKALRNSHRIKIPVLLLTAGNDSFVTMDGSIRFKRRAANVDHLHFEKAKHELFNGTDEIRAEYYSKIFSFIEEVFKQLR